MDDTLKKYCYELPKVELHAHLNTSYSLETLKELQALSNDKESKSEKELWISENKELDASFTLFTKIQKLVTTEDAVYLLTRRVIAEFCQDNVKYLELRSTPKHIEATGMTRELYLRTMIRAVKDCEKEGLDITVRLLPSIDRRLGVDVAQITVDLAHKLMKEFDGVIVGIDFSGDPKVGNAADYIPVFLDAVNRGLRLALHLAEIPLHEETKEVLTACAENCNGIRIGHGTFLHRYNQGQGHEEIEEFVIKNKIPIEACITSNLKGSTVDKLENHHFKYWKDRKHPVVLCTDGKGAFVTSLSEEYHKAAMAFDLFKASLKDLALSSVDLIFDSDQMKDKLREKIVSFN